LDRETFIIFPKSSTFTTSQRLDFDRVLADGGTRVETSVYNLKSIANFGNLNVIFWDINEIYWVADIW